MQNLSENFRGALFMSISMAGFALNDATIKLISGELGFWIGVMCGRPGFSKDFLGVIGLVESGHVSGLFARCL